MTVRNHNQTNLEKEVRKAVLAGLEKKYMTRKELARKAGYSYTHIVELLNGSRSGYFQTWQDLLDVVEVDMLWQVWIPTETP